MVHTAEEIADFFDTTGRELSSTWSILLAADGGADVAVHMPPGEGERFRTATKQGRHRCLLPSCSGLLWVHAGGRRMHHWVHRPGQRTGEHSPEQMWHLAAKAALSHFAREQHPDAIVHEDTKFTPSRKNKPDVWVQWDGGNVAFEAQHSAITSKGLELRNANYGNDAITPVWLFSHLAAAAQPFDGGQVYLRDAHRLATKVGPLRWFNPDTRMVLTGYVQESLRPDVARKEIWNSAAPLEPITYTRMPILTDDRVRVRLDSLDDCTLDAEGLHTPADAWIDQQSEAASRLEEEARNRWLRAVPPQRFDPEPSLQTTSALNAPHLARPDADPSRALRSRFNPYAEPCRFCGGGPMARKVWPSWYIPPKTVKEVAFCSRCGEILGSLYIEPEPAPAADATDP